MKLWYNYFQSKEWLTMQYKEQTINCPKCNKNIKIKMLEQIDESKFKDVISRKIFKFKCSYCKMKL